MNKPQLAVYFTIGTGGPPQFTNQGLLIRGRHYISPPWLITNYHPVTTVIAMGHSKQRGHEAGPEAEGHPGGTVGVTWALPRVEDLYRAIDHLN